MTWPPAIPCLQRTANALRCARDDGTRKRAAEARIACIIPTLLASSRPHAPSHRPGRTLFPVIPAVRFISSSRPRAKRESRDRKPHSPSDRATVSAFVIAAPFVIAELDPAIHPPCEKMDPRVKPAGDDENAGRARSTRAGIASHIHRATGRPPSHHSSSPGLTRRSIRLAKRWTRGSSPRVTTKTHASRISASSHRTSSSHRLSSPGSTRRSIRLAKRWTRGPRPRVRAKSQPLRISGC
jgi:hypothetical protein